MTRYRPGDRGPAPQPLRIGILGVARISGEAVVLPAQALGHRLVAVASRDRRRAEFFADLCGVERVHDSNDAVLDDPDVEAVYIPQIPTLHEYWALAAIAAGKHVLCEKPLCTTAAQVERVRAAARSAGVIVHEAYHHLCHPLWDRLRELTGRGGVLGELVSVDVDLAMRAPDPDDPRRSARLGGGALLDLGCYGLQTHHLLGAHTGAAPTVVDAASDMFRRATDPADAVDDVVRAELSYGHGATGSMRASITDADTRHRLAIVGTHARITVDGFLLPHLGGDLTVELREGRPAGDTARYDRGPDEKLFAPPSTYTHQLDRFARHVSDGTPMPWGWTMSDSAKTLRLVDDVRSVSGIPPPPS